jgi:hypothetical protein
MSIFHHQHIYPFVDYVLTSKQKQKDLDLLLQDKCLFFTDSPKSVVEKLSTAKVLYIYPDTFDQWTDILLFIHQKKPLPVKLMIFADSDIPMENDHLDALFAFFGETEFWIQNWIGYHPRCTLLPLGTSNQMTAQQSVKETRLGISYLNLYNGCKAREEFFKFLNENPSVQTSCFPKTTFQDYCDRLSKVSLHTCPMGEGYDTFRFWESLAVGTVPVVKEHLFYDALAKQYPDLPMIRLNTWNKIQEIETIPAIPDLPYLYKDFWVSKIKSLLE